VSGRVTLTSPIGRGVLHNIECAETRSLVVDGDTLSCHGKRMKNIQNKNDMV